MAGYPAFAYGVTMKRSLYSAQYEMNPTSTEKLPEEFHSGDTLSDPEGWELEYEQSKTGSVKNGLSVEEPLNDHQIKMDKRKRR